MKNNKILSILIIGVIVLVGIGLFLLLKPGRETTTVRDQFRVWNLKAQGASEYKIIKRQKLNLDNFSVLRISARDGSSRFKIERFVNIQKKKAQKYIKDQRLLLESIFATKPAPYPGAISNELEPAEKFKPVYEKVSNGNFKGYAYQLHAGKRLNYGATSDDLVYYKVVLSYLYSAKHKELYKLEIFVPKTKSIKEAKKIIKSFDYID